MLVFVLLKLFALFFPFFAYSFVCSTTLERALSRLVVSWWLARIPSVLYLQELCENLLYLQEGFGNICCHQLFLRSRIFLYMHEIFIQEIAQPIIKDLKYHSYMWSLAAHMGSLEQKRREFTWKMKNKIIVIMKWFICVFYIIA